MNTGLRTLVFEVNVSEEQLDEVRRTLDLTGVPCSVLKKGTPIGDGVVLREGYARIIKALLEAGHERTLEAMAEEYPGTEIASALNALDLGLDVLA